MLLALRLDQLAEVLVEALLVFGRRSDPAQVVAGTA